MSENELKRIPEVFAKQQTQRWKMVRSSASERVVRLERLRDSILAMREEIYQALEADFKKHRTEVEVTELHPTLAELGHAIKHLAEWMEPQKVATPLLWTGTRSFVRYEPKGQVLILSPWNYPFYLFIDPLIAAVAAGNVVMTRPSEKVKATSRMLKKLVERAFPEEEVAVFNGGYEVADALLELPFNHFFFTGSTAIGKKVMTFAARHLASVTLELGGKSPTIVDETANIAHAATRIVWGKFINAGQTCVAPDHVFVHETRRDELLEKAAAVVRRFYGETDDQRALTRDFCRLVDDKSVHRLSAMLEASVAKGARVVIGGRTEAKERFIAPTILADVRTDSPSMKEEIFGPILPVLTYRAREEIYEFTRSRGQPLALYVFSRSRKAIDELVANIPSGGACINNTVIHLANSNLPFGGVGDSGLGNYHGHFGFKALSHERGVMVQGAPALIGQFYPPYHKNIDRLLQVANRVVS